jgi:hypothetical protein
VLKAISFPSECFANGTAKLNGFGATEAMALGGNGEIAATVNPSPVMGLSVGGKAS